ncbi:MAG: hypothetical protein VKL97_00265 [Cyanobacteriota bacterium]|nr:hypothetical protein [Cyanobacteriota bacterium]
MACPRCGCRMLSKVGSGGQARLICCDCRLHQGLQGGTARATAKPAGRSSLISTALLLTLFATTAAVLMTLQDQHDPSLLDGEQLKLEQSESDARPLRRLSRLRLNASERSN